MERPTLRQLEILGEVARAGTFRGAARDLGLSQVAVSDHIKQLENRLGCSLFVRNAGGKPSLSPAGQVVLEHGRNVLFACDSLISAARTAAGEDGAVPARESRPAREPRTARVRKAPPPTPLLPEEADAEGIAQAVPMIPPVSLPEEGLVDEASPEIAAIPPVPVEHADNHDVPDTDTHKPNASPSTSLDPDQEKPITIASHPAILSRFQEKLAAAQEAFPDRPISVDFGRYTADAAAAALRSGGTDIALFYAMGEVPGLASTYLWSESWSLFARADHPLAQKDNLMLADCVDMPVILFAEDNPLRPMAEAILRSAGLWPTPTVLETDDYAAIAAELDYGEAFFPAFGVTAQQFAARPGLRRLAIAEPLGSVQVRRAVGQSESEDPTVAALAGLLG